MIISLSIKNYDDSFGRIEPQRSKRTGSCIDRHFDSIRHRSGFGSFDEKSSIEPAEAARKRAKVPHRRSRLKQNESFNHCRWNNCELFYLFLFFYLTSLFTSYNHITRINFSVNCRKGDESF